MQIHKLRELAEFDDKRFSPRVLMNRPGYRLVLLNLRRGQGIPEHATKEMVTVYAISGHITFYEAQSPFELYAGEVLFIEGGVPHALEAHEDSTLLVVAAGNSVPVVNPELDLRAVPHPNRHPLVFARFDALAVDESFELVNDHDPIPLYRQMDAMRPGQAVWSYLERGPEVFRIRVLRIAPLSGPAISTPAQPEALLGIQR
jgi:uncharacterized protein (DUF2249 family)/mannose-6-phosphate isomerase-like protein (cupin superfamily)